MELTISPLSAQLNQIRLNARQASMSWTLLKTLDILKVTIDEQEAPFAYSDPLAAAGFLPDHAANPFYHMEFTDAYVRAVQEGDKGELTVFVPDTVQITTVISDLPNIHVHR